MKLDSLKNAFEFNIVNKEGIKFTSPYFIMVFLPNFASKMLKIYSNKAELKPHFNYTSTINRFCNENYFLGFKISKKVGKSVKRNKIRRRVKALFQVCFKTDFLNLLKACAIIFIPRSSLIELEEAKLKEEITRALSFFARKTKTKQVDEPNY
jgi:ribonuclease P protein component